MAPHSSTLAWKIPWTDEPGRLQSMGLLRVGHDSVTSISLFTFMHWRRKWQPTPVFLPGESQGQGSLVGCRLWGSTESDMTEVTQQQQQLQPHALMIKLSWGLFIRLFNPHSFSHQFWVQTSVSNTGVNCVTSNASEKAAGRPLSFFLPPTERSSSQSPLIVRQKYSNLMMLALLIRCQLCKLKCLWDPGK